MTIQQRPDDAAIQHTLEGLVLFSRLPFSNNLITFWKAPDAQALRIRGPATEAGVIGCVRFL
jgi:hypothetical protein